MLEWLETIFFNIGQKLVDYRFEIVSGVKDFKLTLETVKRNLKALHAKAFDVDDQIKNARLSGQKKRKREVENWLEEVQIVEREFVALVNEVGFIKQFFSGDQVGKLNQRVDRLLQQSENFGELVLDRNEGRGDLLLTTKLIGESFDKILKKAWELLVVHKVSSIGICGMGGVGKTTLAKHIHNRFLKETQCNVYWITVSQVFTIKGLQDGIAKVMRLELLDEDSEDKRAVALNHALSKRRDLVLILDDVWRNISLEKVGDPLHVKGCRLIITTRSLEVCHRISCQEVILVRTLSRHDSWNLFRKTLGPKTKLNPQVEKIAKCVANKCSGLPLGIITLAGSMRGVTNIHVWKNTLVELEESLMEQETIEDEVFGVLKFSFDRLDPIYQREERKKNEYTKLQLCFLFCSLYPEDHRIRKNELICLFISENLMDKRKTREAEFDQGHAILDKLVNVCLLEDKYHVRMHDLVRSMALKIARGNKRFIVLAGQSLKEIPNEQEWEEDLEKVSLMRNQILEFPFGISPNCPKLSTLLLNHNPLKFIPKSFFLRMSGLQVLNLSKTRIRELPDSLSNLEMLNTLLLRKCRDLVFLPYLGKLKALKELDLSFTSINQVPQGMENLVNLKFLSIFGMRNLEVLSTGLIPKYAHLQHLTLSHQVQAHAIEIGQLKQLEVFQGRFETIGDFNLFMEIRKNHGCNSCYYSISVEKTSNSNYWEDWLMYETKKIQNIYITGCNLRRGEEEDHVIMIPEDINELVFDECEGLSSCLLDDLAQLSIAPKSFKNLKIRKCKGIECILYKQFMSKEEDKPAFSCHSLLRSLEGIRLISLPSFTSIGIDFFSLKYLDIYKCNKIKKLGLRGSDLQNIEYICIDDCEEIEEIIQVEDDISQGEISIPKLGRLLLERLPKLNSICNAKLVCSSIEFIHLKKCQNLKKLPLLVPNLEYGSCRSTQLRMYIDKEEKQWWESLEWEHPVQREVVLEYG